MESLKQSVGQQPSDIDSTDYDLNRDMIYIDSTQELRNS